MTADYEKQIADMQETIKEKIPKEARKIALRGILDNEIQILSASYTKVRVLQSELKSLMPDDPPDNTELMKNVNKIIEPSYSQNRLNNLFSTLFYLVSIISSFISMVLSYSIYRIVSPIILLFQMIIFIRLTISIIRANCTKEELAHIGRKICSVLPTIFMTLSVIFFWGIGLDFVNEDILWGMSLMFFIVHIILWVVNFNLQEKERRSKKLLGFWALLSIVCIGTMIAFLFSLIDVFIIISMCTAIINIIFLCICSFIFNK